MLIESAPAAGRVIGPYLHPLLDACAATGVDRRQLAHALGLADDFFSRPHEHVPARLYVQTLELAARLSTDKDFSLRVAEQVRPGSYGLLGLLLLSCRTLGEALTQVLRFESLVHDLGRSRFSQPRPGVGRFVWDTAYDSPLLAEVVFAGMHAFSGWLCGRQLPLLALQLRAAHCSPGLAGQCRIEPELNASENALEFAIALHDWPLPHADPSLFVPLQSWAEARLRERQSRPDDLPLRLRTWMRSRLPSWPDLPEAAQQLGTSGRSLQRQLRLAGSSFKAERETLRREIACDYLQHSRLDITEIAHLLGYQELSAFSHAFHQWFGCSPQRYRLPQDR